ncbi:helix-turn-helix domain-containing protein (plasmid) [Hymenobacter sp. NBH84]|uniref:helix-turn-helix domain-containing protein n=1 Tax=Hymenobacter sp. NBH84 TaxID=2596915 RepID=UPI0016284D0B|nr:XRE family transcriptional regulator [Hymenobacter sp. NBH84]QNE42332.1 helix-turn-helix domain-containing protein [Hymenobacter sp. NBH84]
MKHDKLSLIGVRILELRKAKKMSLRELAKRSNLSAGLLSKIENFRTVPSLSVLIEIANSLEVDVSVLVKNINGETAAPYLLVRAGEGRPETRDDSKGLLYRYLLSQDLANYSLRVNEVIINPNTYRKPLSTNALELIYVLEGTVQYGFKEGEVAVSPGDTLYFDGLLAHSVRNTSDQPARLFKVYLLRHTD